jgi:hypothetical protein
MVSVDPALPKGAELNRIMDTSIMSRRTLVPNLLISSRMGSPFDDDNNATGDQSPPTAIRTPEWFTLITSSA